MDEEGPGLRIFLKEPEKGFGDAAVLSLGGSRSLDGVGDVTRDRPLGGRGLRAADVAERLADLRVDDLPRLPQNVLLRFAQLKKFRV